MPRCLITHHERRKKLLKLCNSQDRVNELIRLYFDNRRHFREHALHVEFTQEQINLVLHLMETV